MFTGIKIGMPMCGGGLSMLNQLKLLGNLTFFKDFVSSQVTPNADYSVGVATATVTAARDATHPATYVNSLGVVVLTTTANVLRYQGGYYDRYGFNSLKGFMIEEAGTNLIPASNNPTDATWTKTNITASAADAGSSSPDGTATVPSLTASSANGTFLLASAVTGQTYSVWLKRKTGTGNIQITADGGTTYTTFAPDSTWRRFSVSASSASQKCGIKIVTNGDAVYVYGNQYEDKAYYTSYIPTTAGALGRVAESIKFANTGNRTAASESIFIRFAPYWNCTSSAGTNRLLASDTKDRAIHFDSTLKSFTAYSNKTDDVTDKASQTYQHVHDSSMVFASTFKHSSPYITTYKDGISQGTYTTDDFTDPAWGTSFYLGSDSSAANQLNGVIQSVAIYSDAKVDSTVSSISNILGISSLPSSYLIIQQYRKNTLASAQRIRLKEPNRNYIIIRNMETSNIAQVAFTTVNNNDNSSPTTGFTDINPGEEWYETDSTNQVYFRPKVDGQSVTVEIEVSITRG